MANLPTGETIEVIVRGPAKSGKSTVAQEIANALVNGGFTVQECNRSIDLKIGGRAERKRAIVQNNPLIVVREEQADR